jgi:undecaprenyl-diphosphatase
MVNDLPTTRFPRRSILCIVSGFLVFVATTGLVRSGVVETADIDAVKYFRNADGELPRTKRAHLVQDTTALGGWVFMTLLTTGIGTALANAGHRRSAKLLAIVMVGGVILTYALKWGFDRDRPPYASYITSKAFPSGHALMATAFYLTLGSILYRLTEKRNVRGLVIGFSVALPALVGFSRVYLGVHYPTDVVAGWALGVSWATLCWSLFGEHMGRVLGS